MNSKRELYSKIDKFIPNHKMGFKILEDSQLKNIFPSYELLIDKIKFHREKLNEHERIYGIDSQYNLMYDNVYSIMGKRGSGKTSAIFTLKKKIEMEFENDIVLPVIMPEMMKLDSSVIGWIISMLDNIVCEQEKKIKNNSSINQTSNYFRNCKFVADNPLRKAYKRINELHFSGDYKNDNSESISTAIGNSQLKSLNEYKFAEELAKFWDVLVESIVESEDGDEKKEKNPLIYLMFDDVDLTPEKIMEILSTIVKYLSHPNLIVIVTADEDLFYEVIENDFKCRINKTFNTYDILRNSSIGEYSPQYPNVEKEYEAKTIKETAQLYIDKVLPPSSRFYLKEFDTCIRRRYFIEKVASSNQVYLEKTIEEFLKDIVVNYIKERTGNLDHKEFDNFLYYQGDKNNFLQAYLLFWGNTSRQLANECFIVSDLFRNLITAYKNAKKLLENSNANKVKEEYVAKTYECIYNFLINTIKVNPRIKNIIREEENFVNSIFLINKNQWPLYVDYRALNKFYYALLGKAESDKQRNNIVKEIISIYVMMFFVENIMLIGDELNDKYSINKGRIHVHGVKYLVEMLDDIIGAELSLIKNSRDKNAVAELLNNYEMILYNPSVLNVFSISRYSDVKDYMYPLYTKKIDEEISEKDLYKWHVENPLWFKTISKMIFSISTGMYGISEREMRMLFWGMNINICDSYFSEMKSLGNQAIKNEIFSWSKNKTRIYETYGIYYAFMRKRHIFDNILEELKHIDFYEKEQCISLSDIKNTIYEVLFQKFQEYKEMAKVEKALYEDWFRVICFLNCTKQQLWNHKEYTEGIIRSEIERIRSTLVQNYKSLEFYTVENSEDIIMALENVRQHSVSDEVLLQIDEVLTQVQQKAILVSSINKLFDLFARELKRDATGLFSNNIYKMTAIEECRKSMRRGLFFAFSGEGQLELGLDIIVRHEALIHLQKLYVNVLSENEVKWVEQQNIDKDSFFAKYDKVMKILLKKGEQKLSNSIRQSDEWNNIYLGKYLIEIAFEAINEYFERGTSISQSVHEGDMDE